MSHSELHAATLVKIMRFVDQVSQALHRKGADARAEQALFVCIDEELRGMRFGWGPEIEELGERLARLAAQSGLGSFQGIERRSWGYRLRFHTEQPRRLMDALLPIVCDSPMAAAASMQIHDQPPVCAAVGSGRSAAGGERP